MHFLIFFTFFIFFPQAAWGNFILPILAVQWPLMWIAFAPIVLIETWVMQKKLADICTRDLLKATFWANLTSTLVGMPVTWLIASPITLYPTGWKFFLVSSWFGKGETFGLAFLMIIWWGVSFPASYQIEKWVTRKYLRSLSPLNKINEAVFKANLTSYGILFLPTGFATLYFWFKS